MAMVGRTTCAVHGCTALVSGSNNLCDAHRLPGMAVRVGKSTMLITAWSAEHGGETGIILLNDFALGDLFSGRTGFEERLREQGFEKIRNLATLDELEEAKAPSQAKKVADWSGPWITEYPWEINP